MRRVGKDRLKGFIRHGVKISGSTGNQTFGYCPFSEKRNKFYINTDNLLWDSKSAGLSGNFHTFLTYIHKLYQEEITTSDLKVLSKDRSIPLLELRSWNIGKTEDGEFVIPIKNEKGVIVDLRMYRIGNRTMSTPTCKTGLLGLDELVKSSLNETVFVCEGEWDCMSMKWLLKVNNRKGVVVGVPGANTFKDEWIPFFKDRKVILLYDNDNAGEEGEHIVLKKIGNVAKEFRFIHWTDKFSMGSDIRDFVALEAMKNKRPKRCITKVTYMLKTFPRKEFKGAKQVKSLAKPRPDVDKTMNWEKLSKLIKSWLKVRNLDHFLMSCAVVLSNHIEGDPIWLFAVAAPGEGKSELLASFRYCEEVYTTSSITPNALISGFVVRPGEEEPSLLPQLDGKTLIIKDMSTIQTMKQADRESLLGILRDAYDGSAGKRFGTGADKHFESHFSMLCGTTPTIYQLDAEFSSLGERFLKFFIGEYLDHDDQIGTILKAMDNVGKETNMREKIAVGIFSFIENIKEYMRSKKYKPPVISEDRIKKIAHLAAWISRMKGVVSRDKFQKSVILNKAFAEVGTRTGKQLKRVLLCIPTVILRGYETEFEWNLLKKVALDSISAKREDMFREIYLNCPTLDDTIDVGTLALNTKYSYSSISRILDDMVELGIIEKIGNRIPFKYTASKVIRTFTKKAELYEDEGTKNRKSRYQHIKENVKPRTRRKLKRRIRNENATRNRNNDETGGSKRRRPA